MAARKQTRPISIRPATRADLPSIAPIWLASHAAHARRHPTYFSSLSKADAADAVRTELTPALRDPAACVLVAALDDDVVGFAEARLVDTPASHALVAERRLHLVQLAVLPRARRRGCATALLAACKAWGTTHGARSLVLTLWQGNRGALAFYRRHSLTPLHSVLACPLD